MILDLLCSCPPARPDRVPSACVLLAPRCSHRPSHSVCTRPSCSGPHPCPSSALGARPRPALMSLQTSRTWRRAVWQLLVQMQPITLLLCFSPCSVTLVYWGTSFICLCLLPAPQECMLDWNVRFCPVFSLLYFLFLVQYLAHSRGAMNIWVNM